MSKHDCKECPRCGGTGKLRITHHVCIRYQDCSEWQGPFKTAGAAKAWATNFNKTSTDGVASYHEQEERNS